jgi:hypothetical protein
MVLLVATGLILAALSPAPGIAGDDKVAVSNSHSVKVVLVFDTSPTTAGVWDDMADSAKQAVTALRPGDHLEVISAHHGDGRLHLSQEIKTADARELSTIGDLLKNIKRGSFFDADIAAALEQAYQRLDQQAPRQASTRAIVIVLSDGDVGNSDEVQRILRLAANLRARKWEMYFTGTADTSRKLLVAASQGEFHWSLVKQAGPAKWIDQARQAATEARKAASSDATAKMPERKPDLVDQAPRQDPNNKERNPLRIPSTRPAETSRQPATLPGNPFVRPGPATSPVPAPASLPACGAGELAGQGRPAPSVIPPATAPTVPQVHAGPAGAAVATTPRPTVMPPAPAVIAERAAGDEKGQAFTAKPPQPVVPDDPAGSRRRPAASSRPPLPPTASAPSAASARTPTLSDGPTTAGGSAQVGAVPLGRLSRPANTRTGTTENGDRPLPAERVGAGIRPAGELQSRPSEETREGTSRQHGPQVPSGTKGPHAGQSPATRATEPSGTWWASFFSRMWDSWLARIIVGVVVIGVMAVTAIAVARGLVAARRWRIKVDASLQRVPRQAKLPEVLLAQVNGQTYRLGAVNGLRPIHVGARQDNVIRLTDPAIAPRHLRLFSSRRGLMVRNLARTPVLVNGSELRPRRKVQLALPAAVKLGEKATLDLRLAQNGVPEE